MLLQSKKLLGALAVLGLLVAAGPAFAQTYTTPTPTSASVTGAASGTTDTSGTTGTDTTGTTGVTTSGSTTPGAPNTGAGGDTATNLLLLGVSGLIVVAGGVYLARQAATAR